MAQPVSDRQAKAIAKKRAETARIREENKKVDPEPDGELIVCSKCYNPYWRCRVLTDRIHLICCNCGKVRTRRTSL